MSAVAILANCPLHAQVQSATHGTEFTIQNQLLAIHYHLRTGRMDILWRDGHQLTGIESAVLLAGGDSLLTSAYATHAVGEQQGGSADDLSEFTFSSTAPGKPSLLQHVWVSDRKPWISMEAEVDSAGSAIGTRHFDTVLVKGPNAVQIGRNAALRVLHVPFDNDMWFRFDSVALDAIHSASTISSEEVTTIYDNTSRQALVLGSIDHSTWKTAIDVRTDAGQLNQIDIYGGISSATGVRTDTHDTIPHGLVSGTRVVSPRIFIGSFSDWREGLETYGAANAAVHPPLVWPAGVPRGWNSWAAYADKISYQRYLGSAEFLQHALGPQGFGRSKVLYVNLDAFWSRLDAVQLADAVATIKNIHTPDGTHFEPGIYWTPFAYWSDDLDEWVEGTGMKYRYRDILLKTPDGSLLPKLDGGRAIDPSHPGAKARTSYFLKQFQQMGFTYLKLDFLSHGALEGAHFDPAIQTGIQAYNEGMQQIVHETGNRIFLSLSIAPLFPSGYGHARRLSCDTKGHIGGGDQSTEYMLNSLTYGWWTSNSLYIADPDHVVLGDKADLGARTVTEGKSRLLSAIISGGMILDSSRLADDPQGRGLAQAVYANRRLLTVADEAQVFRPVEGDTGNKATTAFIRKSANGIYLAVFNYDEKQPQTITVPLARIDPALATASLSLTDVATGEAMGPAHGSIEVQLQPAESKLIELRREK